MKRKLKVSYEDLCINDLSKNLKINDMESEVQDKFLGQEKAIETLDFGLRVNSKGYNIYLTGEVGTHKKQYLIQYLEELSKSQPVPNDWCYVYNFKNELKPIAISLPAGKGRQFRDDVSFTIERLLNEINECVESEEYKEAVEKIKESYYDEGEKLLKYIKDRAKELGFYTQISDGGLYFVPVIEGKKISEKTYDDLSVEDQDKIINNLTSIEEESEMIMDKVKEYKKEADNRVKEYEDKTILNIIDTIIENLIMEYKEYNKISKYLIDLKDDLISQINVLINKEESDNDDLKALLNSIVKEDDEVPKKYSVNLLVDNSELEGAPIVNCINTNYNNIVGRVEFDNELGNLVTDFSKIQAGVLHQANGGYLIINASDVLTTSFVWDFIKKSLLTEKIEFENIREKLGGVPLKSVTPEAIPLNIKIILLGNQRLYQLLYYYDDDFSKLFKVLVEFDYEMTKTDQSIKEYETYIEKYIKEKNLLPINEKGKKRVLSYSSKLAGNRFKLSTKISNIENLLEEADYWARKDGEDKIYEEHIKKTINEKEKRVNFIKNKTHEMITSNKIKIDFNNSKVGQINGLAVMSYGESTFGKPTRITATTYMGQSGMINIEKEAGLSGSIHNKGINILSGYLGQKYAQEKPLSLTCSLCFEQNYSSIDGDSASSTELYAILSSLSEVPIKQYLAVTGSVDQRGNIQPIGGVTEKVEGFYDVCKTNGLTGKQGVIIPRDNVEELILNDEILEDIKKEKFHVYAIETIDEGIELLTGKKMTVIDELVKAKLEKYYRNRIGNDEA
ncbi:lon-related putative ATP-dependent protease [Natranaerovirga pectinivora]|uniref:endopeptidase La n=1 Tax=Natranaerovirga pectinivora TaxID=682400 RepID=A0A4R3MK44_9FIRM|nr:ATP-binding protein [Natranaerovirga pectinivora]TCT13776.1 lon-related putative ATP-dependent protease [Natranaerovirga pectinivora]